MSCHYNKSFWSIAGTEFGEAASARVRAVMTGGSDWHSTFINWVVCSDEQVTELVPLGSRMTGWHLWWSLRFAKGRVQLGHSGSGVLRTMAH